MLMAPLTLILLTMHQPPPQLPDSQKSHLYSWSSLYCIGFHRTWSQIGLEQYLHLVLTKDYISGCSAFSINSQSVSFLQAYLLFELISSAILAETGGKCPLVFSVIHVVLTNLINPRDIFKILKISLDL